MQQALDDVQTGSFQSEERPVISHFGPTMVPAPSALPAASVILYHPGFLAPLILSLFRRI